MKTLVLVTFVIGLGSASIAGEYGSPEISVISPVAVTATSNWDGFYVGGSISQLFGVQTNSVALPEYDLNGPFVGGFAGYNVHNGGLIYGAEAAYSLGSAHEDGTPDYQFTDVLDVKARLGFGFGDALVYGVAGWSSANWDDSGVDYTASGFNAGVGVDYLISDSFFVGAEYLFRDLKEDVSAQFEAPLQSVQVRAGFNF
ncbi:MAG: porin family protein [Rhodobacteraceae bacterium]|nr:porin family protein [Paracoccaceae bacterium]